MLFNNSLLFDNSVDNNSVDDDFVDDFVDDLNNLKLKNDDDNNDDKNTKHHKISQKSLLLIKTDYENSINNSNLTKITEMFSKTSSKDFIIKNLNIKSQNIKLWAIAINKKDLNLLNLLKSFDIEIKLSNLEIIKIIQKFKSVDYLEIIEFLFDYIFLNEDIAYNFLFKILHNLTTPNNENEQYAQFNIIYYLISNYEKPLILLKSNIRFVIRTLNINLVKFVIEEYKININELVADRTNLQWVIDTLNNNNPPPNTQFAYEVFDYLLISGADIKLLNNEGRDIYHSIKQLNNQQTRETLRNIILQNMHINTISIESKISKDILPLINVPYYKKFVERRGIKVKINPKKLKQLKKLKGYWKTLKYM